MIYTIGAPMASKSFKEFSKTPSDCLIGVTYSISVADNSGAVLEFDEWTLFI